MTTYTTTAIATNSVTNTVTVVSIANMVPGIPITFSGTTFGGITTGSTYYIGTIIYGYPTSSITLTSLPGGAVFALDTDTGSMTANWSSGGQQMIITTPPGESLNSSFTKINTNFDQIWAAGPVNSNVKISDNSIYTLNTNGDLVLNPNGIGKVVANAHVVPDTTLIRNLGSPTEVWNSLYVNYLQAGNLVPSAITIPVANLHILGGNSNNVLQTDGTGNLSWTAPLALAGGDFNYSVQYNDNGVLNGSSSFTFDNSSNTVYVGNLITDVANLNSLANITISGGQAGFVLQTDGTGNLSWVAPIGNTQQILDQQIVGDNTSLAYDLIMPAFTNTVMVSINGVLQLPSTAYVVSNQTIVFSEPLLSSEIADIRFLVGGPSGNNHPNGANGSIQFNSGDGFGGTANLTYNATTGNLYSTNAVVAGNITASYYYGDGSQLSNIKATANTGDITFANNVISTSDSGNSINIVGPQQTPVVVSTGGNAATSQLLWSTNIGALAPEDTFNAVVTGNTQGSQISAGNTGVVIASNSVAGLKTWTFANNGTLSSTGTIVAGNVNATRNVVANVDVSAVGNIVGTYVFANAAFMTGIPLLYGNSNVANYLNGYIGNVIPVANLSYSLGNSTQRWQELWVSNVHASGNITGANTVSARFFVGDGSGLINLPSNNTVPAGSNTQVQFNNSGAFGGSTGFTFNKTSNTLAVTGNVTGGNIVTAGIISATGNIQGQYILGNGAFLTGITGGGGNYGNSNVATFLADFGSNIVVTTGNVSAGNVLTSDQVIANGEIQSGTGFFTGGYLSVNGDTDLHDTTVTGNLIINNGGPEWSFNTDGSLTLPAGNLVGLGNVVGPGNISYPFGPGPVLLADNSANNSAYFSLTAVANADGVLGYVGIANFGGNSSTGLIETSDGTGNTYDWYFQNDGTTAFPNYTFPAADGANGQVFATDGSGTLYWANASTANTGNVTFNDINIIGTGNLHLQPDPANAGSYLDIFLTSGPDLHLVASASANLILGKDDQANVMTSWNGNVYVQSWNLNTSTPNTWTFGGDGSTIFPTLTTQRGDNPSGTIQGQTLLFGDAAQEAVISTPDGNPTDGINSQRLVINPGQGYGSGEGGDIYLWAGRGGPTDGSGGDVKIRGGQGMADGTGGYIRIEGGDTQGAGYPGYIDIKGGQGSTTQGAYVRITGGQGATNGGEAGVIGGYGTDVGGDANITAGYGGTNQGGNVNITGGGSALGLSGYGNVNVNAGASQWVFNNTGVLTAPGAVSAVGNVIGGNITTGGIANLNSVRMSQSISWPDYSGSEIYEDGGLVINGPGGVYATGNIAARFEFNDGAGNSSGLYSDIGNSLVYSVGNVIVRSNNLSQTDWTFGTDGNLSIPGGGAVWTLGAGTAGLTANFADPLQVNLGLDYASNTATLAGNSGVYIQTNSGNTQWSFSNTGNLNLPQGGWIGAAGVKGDGTMLTGGTGQIASLTSFYADAPGVYSSCVTVNPDGNVNISTYGNGTGLIGSWAFDNTGNLTVPGNIIMTTGIVGSGASPAPTLSGFSSVSAANLSASGNVTGSYILGNGSQLTGIVSSYGNSNVNTLLAAWGSNTISTTGNITAGYLFGNGSQLTGLPATYGNANVTTFLAAYGSNTVSTTGNITSGNLITSGSISSTGNVQAGNIRTAGQVSATGNITTAGNFIGNGAALTNVTVSVAGNVIGTQSNVGIVAGSYTWTFNNTGNLTLPGNTFAVNYANNTPVDVVTRFESFWTVPIGNSTQSFTVAGGNTYQMWVDCNIPNGILAWNATATVTNTNVPVVGAQYAWVYNGGGTPIDFTSIPNQFIGTSNTIVRSSVAPSATTNKFDFGINNTSGGNVTVRYGWIQIS